MNKQIIPIQETNLSIGWARAFLALMERGVNDISPLIVTLDLDDTEKVPETKLIHEVLDAELRANDEFQIETVAGTIFPHSLWNRGARKEQLFETYLSILPKIRKYQQNRRGTYFQRLIAFENEDQPVNQLKHIIDAWNSGLRRHSALQASIFDPSRDHVRSKMLGFPCLHQVALTPIGTDGTGGLAISGFYATQHVFEKAYGNYLGLCRLGQFLAHEMNLHLVRMTCIAAKGVLGDYPKSSLSKLHSQLQQILSSYENTR
jgi:hypothetical protein